MTELEQWFDIANKKYFKNKLKNVTVRYKKNLCNTRSVVGATWSQSGKPKERTFKVWIDYSLRYNRCSAILTLLHELVHVEQWDQVTDKTCHGRKFQARMRDLAAKGAFDGLW